MLQEQLRQEQLIKELYQKLTKYSVYKINGTVAQNLKLLDIPNLHRPNIFFDKNFMKSVSLNDFINNPYQNKISNIEFISCEYYDIFKIVYEDKQIIKIECFQDKSKDNKIKVNQNFKFELLIDERAFCWCKYSKQLKEYYIGIDINRFKFKDNEQYRIEFSKLDLQNSYEHTEICPALIVNQDKCMICIYDISHSTDITKTRRTLKLSQDQIKMVHNYLDDYNLYKKPTFTKIS